MPLRCPGRMFFITERPFEGGLGAKLYVGVGGPENIVYRVPRLFNSKHVPFTVVTSRDASVATVKSPTAEFEYTLPEDLVGEDVWYQVRTHEQDVENTTRFRPRHLETDDDGDGEDTIYGTAVVVSLEKRDGGGLRIRFVWRPVRDGVQPVNFVVTKLTGSGSVSPVIVPADGAGTYVADVIGLTNDVAYTFRLDGDTGTLAVALVTDIAFTGDAEGPPSVINVVAVEA
jgi:hypothetical protein